MAFQLPVTINTDPFTQKSANYWRIAAVFDNRDRQFPATEVTIELWADAASRADLSARPISTRIITVRGGINLNQLKGSGLDIYGYMYQFIKATDARFSSALDV